MIKFRKVASFAECFDFVVSVVLVGSMCARVGSDWKECEMLGNGMEV